MLIAHRIALDSTNAQRTYFARASGVARFAYHWALAEWKRQYTARQDDPSLPQQSDAALRRRLNAIKRDELRRARGDHRPRLGVPGLLRDARQVPALQGQGHPRQFLRGQ